MTLDGDEGRHAVVVKRIRVGERIALTDGRGTTVHGTVTAAARTSLTAGGRGLGLPRAGEPRG